jgi:hypothetical protein
MPRRTVISAVYRPHYSQIPDRRSGRDPFTALWFCGRLMSWAAETGFSIGEYRLVRVDSSGSASGMPIPNQQLSSCGVDTSQSSRAWQSRDRSYGGFRGCRCPADPTRTPRLGVWPLRESEPVDGHVSITPRLLDRAVAKRPRDSPTWVHWRILTTS